MKKSQQAMISVRLSPEASRKLAAEKTAALSDDQAAKRAEEIISSLKPVLDHVQEKFLRGAKSEHDKSSEKALYDRCADAVVEDLQETLDAIKKNPGSFGMPTAQTIEVLPSMLSSSVLLLYPCCQLSETLTNREFVFYGEKIIKEILARQEKWKGDIPKEMADKMRVLTRDDIFALRNATAEYDLQTKIFALLREICIAMGRKLKSLKAHDAALEALEMVITLDSRSATYRECLDEKAAADFVSKFNAFFRKFRLEMMYGEL